MRTTELVRRNAVLSVHDQPDRGEPLVETQSAVLEDGPDLQRKLTPAGLALPNLARRNERGLRVGTAGQVTMPSAQRRPLTNSKQRSSSAKYRTASMSYVGNLGAVFFMH
jgi:hypothetical protein